jgi:hypothetical protein
MCPIDIRSSLNDVEANLGMEMTVFPDPIEVGRDEEA